MPDPPTAPWETQELKAIIDAEVARLPDKFRSVVVLCLLEGQTNADAAATLGVPVGTVDSRLSTARRKLQDRLVRRGIALSVGVTLEQMLGGPLGATDRTAIQELVSSTVRAVLAEAAGPGTGAVSPAVVNLARGVTTMLTSKLRLFAAVGITLGLLGGAGAGLYFATAADPAKAVARADQKLPPEQPQANATSDPNKPAPPEAKPTPAAATPDPNATGTAALLKPFGKNVPAEGAKLEDILQLIEDQSDLVLRVDVAAFRRVGALNGEGGLSSQQFLQDMYDTKVILPRKAEKLTMRDVLTDALAQISINRPCTFQVRGSQLLIVPAYVPPVRPGANPLVSDDQEPPMVEAHLLNEQIYGGVVSVHAERKPLAEVLADLRKQTGANIVLDPRCEGLEKKATINVTLNDVRLYDALRVIADMSELKMVYAGNIYYVTTPANAKTFEPAPRPPQPQAPGFPGFPQTGPPVPNPPAPAPQ
jgi:hypothetical protein